MLFLDDFLEMLEELPSELRDRCAEMRQIDMDVEAGLERNRNDILEFFMNGASLSDSEKEHKFQLFKKEYGRLRQLSEDKVSMAERMQELVEKYLQHLDKEKTHFKYELEADNPGVTESIEKRFAGYVEAVIAMRKERKRKHANSGSTMTNGELPNKIPKFNEDFGLPQALDGGLNSDEMNSPLMPMLGGTKRKTDEPQTPVLSKKRPSITAMKGNLSVPSSLCAMANSPTPSEKSWTPFSDVNSPSTSMNFPYAAPTPTMPNFVGAESRHGRPRKLTSRVQEMFTEAVHRQRRQHVPTPVEVEDEAEGSDGEDSDDAQKTWCFCGESSYGGMVACDNKSCTIQWFHYGCVGIKDTPKGKWYCPNCATIRSSTSRSASIEPPY